MRSKCTLNSLDDLFFPQPRQKTIRCCIIYLHYSKFSFLFTYLKILFKLLIYVKYPSKYMNKILHKIFISRNLEKIHLYSLMKMYIFYLKYIYIYQLFGYEPDILRLKNLNNSYITNAGLLFFSIFYI